MFMKRMILIRDMLGLSFRIPANWIRELEDIGEAVSVTYMTMEMGLHNFGVPDTGLVPLSVRMYSYVRFPAAWVLRKTIQDEYANHKP